MKWRLIPYQIYSGKENMAIDKIILKGQKDKTSPPTIRFYSWSRPCLSLGYFQKKEKELNLQKVTENSIEVVHRMTGGRVVLHIDELTYSVIAPINLHAWCSSQQSSYRFISQALVEAIQVFNLDLDLSRATSIEKRRTEAMSPCFSSSARNEVVLDGKKIIGSAQKRNADAFLQHGSILCSPQYMEVVQYLNVSLENQTKIFLDLQQKSTCLHKVLKININLSILYHSIWRIFFKQMEISNYEIKGLNRLEQEKLYPILQEK